MRISDVSSDVCSSELRLSRIQRVTSASVTVDGDTLGAIGPGLLALVGVEPGDGDAQVERMTQRLLGYRVFADDQGRMNRSLADSGGGLLDRKSTRLNSSH